MCTCIQNVILSDPNNNTRFLFFSRWLPRTWLFDGVVAGLGVQDLLVDVRDVLAVAEDVAPHHDVLLGRRRPAHHDLVV